MISLAKRLSLSRPAKGERIDGATLNYLRARSSNNAHAKLLELFHASGMSRGELAAMLGKDPARVSRIFASPSNLTIETLSDVVFATTGGSLSINVDYDLDKLSHNRRMRDALEADPVATPAKTLHFFDSAAPKLVKTGSRKPGVKINQG